LQGIGHSQSCPLAAIVYCQYSSQNNVLEVSERKSMMQQKIADNEYGKHYAGNAICRHEGEVHTPQIVGLHNGMLVKQASAKHHDAQQIQQTEMADHAGCDHGRSA